jgi:hypothetical protein
MTRRMRIESYIPKSIADYSKAMQQKTSTEPQTIKPRSDIPSVNVEASHQRWPARDKIRRILWERLLESDVGCATDIFQASDA